MTAIPAWLAATPGRQGLAGHVTQFLGTHASTLLYQGTLATSQATGSGFFSDTQTQWLAQAITTGSAQTAIGYIQLQLSAVGGSPTSALIPPLTVSLYANNSGTPAGSPLASTTISCQAVYGAPFWVSIPLPVTGLTPSHTYQLVTTMVGTSSHYYAWQHSNQTSGAASSATGSSWTTQAYGLMYQVYDQSQVGQLQLIYEDAGARWTQFTYGTNGSIAQVTEYTAGQTATGYQQTTSTLAYSGGLLTGVS